MTRKEEDGLRWSWRGKHLVRSKDASDIGPQEKSDSREDTPMPQFCDTDLDLKATRSGAPTSL